MQAERPTVRELIESNVIEVLINSDGCRVWPLAGAHARIGHRNRQDGMLESRALLMEYDRKNESLPWNVEVSHWCVRGERAFRYSGWVTVQHEFFRETSRRFGSFDEAVAFAQKLADTFTRVAEKTHAKPSADATECDATGAF